MSHRIVRLLLLALLRIRIFGGTCGRQVVVIGVAAAATVDSLVDGLILLGANKLAAAGAAFRLWSDSGKPLAQRLGQIVEQWHDELEIDEDAERDEYAGNAHHCGRKSLFSILFFKL